MAARFRVPRPFCARLPCTRRKGVLRRRHAELATARFQAAAAAAGFPDARPYDLRHSFVSLLIAEGTNVIEVARQAGHSPTMSIDTYGHVFDEASGVEGSSAEEAIIAARLVPLTYPYREASANSAAV